MVERTSFDTPTLPRLITIVDELKRGTWRIPEFQRASVWSDEQRLLLLDSIVKGLPIGSLLVWRATAHQLATYTELSGVPLPPPSTADRYTYLIDGHQRMSTLFGAFVRPPAPRVGAHARRWPLFYVLGSSENPSFRRPPRSEAPPEWLPLDILFDNKALYRFRDGLFKSGKDDLAEEAERLANTFKDYIIPVIPLVTDDLDVVTDAFIRINSPGKRMTEAEMLRALTYFKKEINTDSGFKAIRSSFKDSPWSGIEDKTLVMALKASFGLSVYKASVTELTEILKGSPGALQRLQVALQAATAALHNFGVMGPSSLPYTYQLVTLTALAFRSPDFLTVRRDMLRKWFWRTTYSEYFTGQTGEQIGRDIEALHAVDNGDEDPDIATGDDVGPLVKPQRRNVRTKAFLLFLTTLPADPRARARSRAHLAQFMDDTASPRGRSFSYLFPKQQGVGNVVIAGKRELGDLRKRLDARSPTKEQIEEFVLPASALALLPDAAAFVGAREAHLIEHERRFIEGFGLYVRDAPSDEDDEDFEDDFDLELADDP